MKSRTPAPRTTSKKYTRYSPPGNKRASKAIPVKHRTGDRAAAADTIDMCVLDRAGLTLTFPDDTVLIRACRILDKAGFELYAEGVTSLEPRRRDRDPDREEPLLSIEPEG
ncbi:MAG: hypothetical protein JXA20_05560 [Spirochaetes bacterium]|nr:hypothetical protein [Spirochaetota bacterium]